jgi:ubiquinone biosynthesis protein
MVRLYSNRLSKTFGLSSKTHRKRYKEVISILIKYGFEEFLVSDKGKKIPFIRHLKQKDPQFIGLSRPKRIRLAIEELDGAYVKFAQILSNRPDIIPDEYVKEFESLQDSIPPFSSEEAIRIIEEELNDKLHRLFLMFDEIPLASGSIAQVHRAVLFDGTPVVVKIRRPGIEEKFRIDIDILNYLSQQISKVSFLKAQFKNSNPVHELTTEVFKELDFTNELFNIKKFRANFEGNPLIYVPNVYTSYSSEKIMTMEYVQGTKVTDYKKYQAKGVKPSVIANNLIDLGLIQLFDHRMFHGDPHPGNILIMDDGKICFIDFGLVGTITTRQRQNIIDFIIAFSRNDYKKLTRMIVSYAPKNLYIDEDKLENTISGLLDKYYDKNLKEINVGKALSEIVTIVLKYKISLNFNIYLLIKALSSYEGIGKRIYPEFELAPNARVFAEKLIKEQLSPKTILKEAYFSATDTLALLRNFPGEVKEILSMVQNGRLRVNIGILDLRETIDYAFQNVNKVVNRVVIAIILASIIMGSSIILRSAPNIDAHILYVSAGVGFILSLLIALFVLYSIIRNKGI